MCLIVTVEHKYMTYSKKYTKHVVCDNNYLWAILYNLLWQIFFMQFRQTQNDVRITPNNYGKIHRKHYSWLRPLMNMSSTLNSHWFYENLLLAFCHGTTLLGILHWFHTEKNTIDMKNHPLHWPSNTWEFQWKWFT